MTIEHAVLKCGYQTVIQDLKILHSIPSALPQSITKSLLENIYDENLVVPIKVLEQFPRECESSHSLNVLGPPSGQCFICNRSLHIHNKPISVKYVTFKGEIQWKFKIDLRCKSRGINNLFDKYGNMRTGYRFYKKARDVIVASDKIILDRAVFNMQWAFAQHSWVSFQGFAESWNDAWDLSKNDEIDRRTWADCFGGEN
ncbi:uncharacterized protein LOC141902144 [Tubulanus polymorphus]|uniref:uncharacterized protein LOC141902144 n=1 Tax=Tubulanus polymorphus TaxID=672921 RepID=UPI003DA4F49B